MKLLLAFALLLVCALATTDITYKTLGLTVKGKYDIDAATINDYGVLQHGDYLYKVSTRTISQCKKAATTCVTYKTFDTNAEISGVFINGNTMYVAISDASSSTTTAAIHVYSGSASQTVTAATLRRNLAEATFTETTIPAAVTTAISDMTFTRPRYWFDVYEEKLTLEVYDDYSSGGNYLVFTTKTNAINALTADDIIFKSTTNNEDAVWFDDRSADIEFNTSGSTSLLKVAQSVDPTNNAATFKEFGASKTFNLKNGATAIDDGAAHAIDYENKKVYTYYTVQTNAGFSSHELCVHTVDETAATNSDVPSVCKDQTTIMKDMKMTCALGVGRLICREMVDACTSSDCYTKMLYVYTIKDDATLSLVTSGNQVTGFDEIKSSFGTSTGYYKDANDYFNDKIVSLPENSKEYLVEDILASGFYWIGEDGAFEIMMGVAFAFVAVLAFLF
eukprot:TRINITY_DN59608_c1_g1_i1.p1 TRINITY_DN59608_c1_g1~~TRINITY_DN59608_c1_g1_i1.p1  ORF type:complete len:449 (+),score=101.85 TRINITY_DN59608_c1_g1_i1:23-1369(+)